MHYKKLGGLRAVMLAVALAVGHVAAQAATLDLDDATIADINGAFADGTLTSEKLVKLYLKRIETYDQKGPAINTVITLNTHAIEQARALDKERRTKGPRSPIHGIPIVLKDNFDTYDMPTTAGSLLLKGSIPPDDAFVVKKLRDAGAIILAKVNLSEFASGSGGPNGFSSMGGQTLNPHDLTKGPSGSSGGTGAAIAANFAQFGLGTDTGGSVRGPSSANGIAGLKPTYGLMSRDGIVPLALSYDTGGPMARSVYDVAVALGVMTGVDPADPATQASVGKFDTDYTKYLKRGSLKGARIGVARDFFKQSVETDYVMESAIATLKSLGATVVDPVNYPDYLLNGRNAITQAISGREFKVQVSQYLATLGPQYPHSLAELITRAEAPGSGYTNPWRLNAMKEAQASVGGLDEPEYLVARNEGLALLRAAVTATFEKHQLDALIYPTSPKPAQPIEPAAPGAAAGGAGSATNIANRTGFPDLIVPAGMTKDGLPVTISFFGPAFSEPKLLAYGYDFEQATHARVLPKYTPALAQDRITTGQSFAAAAP
ncbi:MAG TPA: amidase family protein [Povalibacter sp.]|uniref:amidase family protein n=1 Tax=Povalibacter sp. TaxID=1962978 RepID=UPI002C2E1350|nr:amidase family protein [Povalibacter sp.]HMN43704.1 amidase family protein [Povalibacter sp.]